LVCVGLKPGNACPTIWEGKLRGVTVMTSVDGEGAYTYGEGGGGGNSELRLGGKLTLSMRSICEWARKEDTHSGVRGKLTS